MALFNGSAINSTETAKVFNRLWSLQAFPLVRKQNGFLYMILGKPDIGRSLPGVRLEFERSQTVTGKNVEVDVLGALTATSLLADGAEELATVTPSFNASEWGGMEFPLSHQSVTKGIPSSQLKRYRGKEAKTDSFYKDVLGALALSIDNDQGNMLHGSFSGQSTSSVVGRKNPMAWHWAISTGGGDSGGDSTSETGSAYRYYGTIDRQDSANGDFRGVVYGSSTGAVYGTCSLAKFRGLVNSVSPNGGKTDMAVMGTPLYTTHQLLLEQYTTITNAPDMVDFGGEWIRYGNVTFIHDYRTPAGVIGGLDSSTWLYVRNDDPLTESGIVKDITKASAYVIQADTWFQTICIAPNRNFKALGAVA